MNKLGQDPAFPVTVDVIAETNVGVSKHFLATCFALSGIVSTDLNGMHMKQSEVPERISRLVELARLYADEMIKQEQESLKP